MSRTNFYLNNLTMDSFINLAKQGFEAYTESQSGASKTGGQEYNTPGHSNQGGSDEDSSPTINHDEAVEVAQQDGSGDGSLFHSALGFVQGHKQEHTQPVNEEHVTNAHRQAYQEGGASNMPASSLGSAAALQVLKSFSGGGGGSQSQLIGMAMSEASNLFESAGGGSSGSKQDAVNGAAMTIMKLVVQSKFSSFTGGGNSGGMSGLLGLASKFA